MTTSSSPRVWFVTGAGRGLGRAFAEAALERGDQVVGTVRSDNVLSDLAQQYPATLRVLHLDVRERDEVFRAVDAAVDAFGRLDVVVNNAGYGFVGATEELDEAAVHDHIDTNLLGPMWVTQAAIPHMRAQGSGDIVQISTVGAVGSMPTLGLYNAGKWGLEGFSEALAAEVAEFGIHVTIAQLGGFDTAWGTSSMQFASPLPAYDNLRRQLFGTPTVPWDAPSDAEPQGAAPPLAAAALMAHLDTIDRPLRLLVGDDAPAQVATALGQRRDDYTIDPRFTWPAS